LGCCCVYLQLCVLWLLKRKLDCSTLGAWESVCQLWEREIKSQKKGKKKKTNSLSHVHERK
jgi:hypothetical protein